MNWGTFLKVLAGMTVCGSGLLGYVYLIAWAANSLGWWWAVPVGVVLAAALLFAFIVGALDAPNVRTTHNGRTWESR